MSEQQLLSRIKNPSVERIGKSPVVVLPLKVWREIEDCLGEVEIEQSRRLQRKISAARRAKKSYSAAQVKKFAGL